MIAPTKAQIEAATGPTPTTKLELSTVEKALTAIASRGVHPQDLPSPHRVAWAGLIGPKFALTKHVAQALAAAQAEEPELLEEITASNPDTTAQAWCRLQETAVDDSETRGMLGDSRREAVAAGRMRMRAAKARLGAVRDSISRELVDAGRRALELAQTEVDRLAAEEEELSRRFGVAPHVSPLRWAVAGSIKSLAEAVNRGRVNPDLLARFVGPLLPPPAK